jgi:putative membrane protein
MKNIIKIFMGDISRLKNNVIALIVIMGLSVVPCLYAWFNIAASWDPYGSTDQLKIAVVNSDKGYTGELIPLKINVGESVTNELRKNTKMHWVFTSNKDAMNGVKSGDYYAAIVIPKTFSNDMMSMFSTSAHATHIHYYVNQKENAIAPKVTDKTASSIKQSVSENFMSTLVQVELDLMDSLSKLTGTTSGTQLLTNFESNLKDARSSLRSTQMMISALSNMTGSLSSILNTSSSILKSSGVHTGNTRDKIKKIKKKTDLTSASLKSTLSGMDQLTKQIDQVYAQLDKRTGSALSDLNTSAKAADSSIADVQSDVSTILTKYKTVRNNLKTLDDAIPDSMTAAHRANAKILGRMDSIISLMEQLQTDLSSSRAAISKGQTDLSSYRSSVKNDLSKIRSAVSGLNKKYDSSWKAQLQKAYSSFLNTADALDRTSDILSSVSSNALSISAGTSGSLKQLHRQLKKTSARLQKADAQLGKVIKGIRRVIATGSLQELTKIMGNSSSDIGSFLSAPVEVQKVAVYKVANYGSAMAPFYSTLAMWVGAVMLIALMKTELSKSRRRLIKNLRPHEFYFGRLILFTIVGLIQATLITLGDVLYLQIQCLHPFLLLLAGWVTSFVYVNIMYTFTLSFGDVGKAICVVLMVLQIAGSGGTFPIEMAPKAFRMIYPFLPFVHSMTAMRECIAGMYGNTYWLSLLKLCCWLIPMLLLGLVLRKPVIRMNAYFERKLEDTKLM